MMGGVKVKVNLSLYRLLGLQEVEGPRICRQSAHEGGKVVRQGCVSCV